MNTGRIGVWLAVLRMASPSQVVLTTNVCLVRGGTCDYHLVTLLLEEFLPRFDLSLLLPSTVRSRLNVLQECIVIFLRTLHRPNLAPLITSVLLLVERMDDRTLWLFCQDTPPFRLFDRPTLLCCTTYMEQPFCRFYCLCIRLGIF